LPGVRAQELEAAVAGALRRARRGLAEEHAHAALPPAVGLGPQLDLGDRRARLVEHLAAHACADGQLERDLDALPGRGLDLAPARVAQPLRLDRDRVGQRRQRAQLEAQLAVEQRLAPHEAPAAALAARHAEAGAGYLRPRARVLEARLARQRAVPDQPGAQLGLQHHRGRRRIELDHDALGQVQVAAVDDQEHARRIGRRRHAERAVGFQRAARPARARVRLAQRLEQGRRVVAVAEHEARLVGLAVQVERHHAQRVVGRAARGRAQAARDPVRALEREVLLHARRAGLERGRRTLLGGRGARARGLRRELGRRRIGRRLGRSGRVGGRGGVARRVVERAPQQEQPADHGRRAAR
jgi:hypothetical protein